MDTEPLEKIFQHKVIGILLRKGKITREVLKLIMSWRHSGFNIHCGPGIRPGDEEAKGNLARYIIRAFFSHERLTHIPGESKVVYRSRDGKSEKTFAALEWLAALCSHVPNKGEQMVYYYGYYSDVSRGQRKKAKEDDLVPSILQTVISCKEYLKKRARLIHKYRVHPSAFHQDTLSLVRKTASLLLSTNAVDSDPGCVYKAAYPKSQECAGLPRWVSHRQTTSTRRNSWQQGKPRNRQESTNKEGSSGKGTDDQVGHAGPNRSEHGFGQETGLSGF